MAAVADRIIAAPFAVVGSIGVVAQIPNVHRLLKKHDVDVELLTAGKYKRTLTVLGENTEEGRQKFAEELSDVHALFQEYVGARRPDLDMDEVATGEVWYGQRALGRRLVDEISTSDEFLVKACADGDVFTVRWREHKKPLERLLTQAASALGTGLGKSNVFLSYNRRNQPDDEKDGEKRETELTEDTLKEEELPPDLKRTSSACS